MKIFVTGASGYIGGAVATRFVEAGHQVRGLVRGAEKAAAVAAFGIEPVLGTLDDAALLTAEAQRSDAVINAASSDHRGAADTLISALAGTGKTLLHTSGTSIVGDEAMGRPSSRIFDESTPLAPEPDKVARVALDRAILGAPGVRGIVLCNSLIYGVAKGPPAASVQLPRLIAQARESGITRYIGDGLNIWSTVHIDDVASLYLLALEKGEAGSFAYVENGEASFRDLVAAIARALHLGAAESWSAEAAIEKWGREMAVFGLGSNSRVRAKVARTWGWEPKNSSAISWIEENVR